MKIKESFSKNVAILSVSGNMMGGQETLVLHDKVRSVVSDGITRVVIDLKGVKWLNSSGLGILVACFTTVTNASGHLKLANVAEKVESILMITQLQRIFDSYDTTEKAVAACKAEA